jgi:hypothetical protein
MEGRFTGANSPSTGFGDGFLAQQHGDSDEHPGALVRRQRGGLAFVDFALPNTDVLSFTRPSIAKLRDIVRQLNPGRSNGWKDCSAAN